MKTVNFPMTKKTAKPGTSRPTNACLHFALNEAGAVAIAGTFNNWDPAQTPLARDDNGEWTTNLKLPAGRHEYRLVVDGAWCDAPGAGEYTENPFGSRNAVLEIGTAG